MKFRRGFVTNSSSTAFLVGLYDNKLTESQKEIILEALEHQFLGWEFPVPKGSDKEIKAYFENNGWHFSDGLQSKITKAVQDGKKIRIGVIDSFTRAGTEAMYKRMWEALDGVDGFEIVDDDCL